MKRLYLIRHAKSSWAFDLVDHDRPLGKRGRKDVMKMSAYLSEHQPKPDHIISSTASRALYTALHFGDAWQLDESQIGLSRSLYHCGVSQTIAAIKATPKGNVLALFGHNPGFTDTANALTTTHIDNLPTCGIIGISFDINHWADVEAATGKQMFFYYPKALPS